MEHERNTAGCTGKKLETEAVVFGVVLVVCLSGGAFALRDNPQLRELVSGEPKYASEGVRLQPLPGYRWQSHERTLVLALKAGCPYCEASIPLYQRLADLNRNGRLKAHPVILYPDASDIPASRSFEFQRLMNVDYVALGVRGTPTVLLVDSRGVVRKKWGGRIPPSDEQAFIDAVQNAR